jgi:hypothetical protein
VAEIEWKGALWKAAYGDLSIKDLLTTLKGFGPMEILKFEKPLGCQGEISLCVSPQGTREITIHHLETLGKQREGKGRKAIQWLRNTFGGQVFVEYPEIPSEKDASEGGSLAFWVRMYREGLVDGLECGEICLYPEMGQAHLDAVEEKINKTLKT